MQNDIAALAISYFEAVHASESWSVDGEPEAQLTTPFTNLLVALAEKGSLGRLSLVRESRLDRTRPDFAVLHRYKGKTRQKGFIELKAPSVSLVPEAWTGRNAKQWQNLIREAEVLLLSNGRSLRLYHHGEPVGMEAALPFDTPHSWPHQPVVELLQRFVELTPAPITSVKDLSERLAIRTADLRDRLLWLLSQSDSGGEAARGGLAAWRAHVHPEAEPRDFADGISQVIAYGMVLAALRESGADADHDGYITVSEAREAIRKVSPVMAAAFAPLMDKQALSSAVEVELSALETLVSAIDAKKVNKSADRRGEPWLYFYEDFLSVYDPDERRQAGVYYTPVSVVRAMVRMVDRVLVEKFDIRLGFADPRVVTLDPATGTGTFPLAVVDEAVKRAEQTRGNAGAAHAAASLAQNLFAFELLPGPYAVAHLRLSQRLREVSPHLDRAAQVVLTDTLESPLDPQIQLQLFGDAEVLAEEQNRAKRIKLNQRVTVIIGNPPYRRVERGITGRGSGGWVLDGKVPKRRSERSLFDDVLKVARGETIFSHIASLYNLYVYFWRWAIWKAFEAHESGPGVVAFITASSWLSGPGFGGLRQLVRQSCDEAFVLDLGGANSGKSSDENIFAIETPVAIVILVRRDGSETKRAARVNYRAYRGAASTKLEALERLSRSADPFEGEWVVVDGADTASFVPEHGGEVWKSLCRVEDLFPWQQPGCMHSRTWPVAPDPKVLEARWRQFASSDVSRRPSLYVTPTAGRSIYTRVAGLKRLADVTAEEPHRPIVRYGYRCLDRQWTFEDPRLAKTESPALWSAQSEKQLYLVSLLSESITEGPAMCVSAHVPDKHYFRGSYGGKDVIPLYRDATGTNPNLTKGLTKALGKQIGIEEPSPEDVAAYVYAMLTAPAFQAEFATELEEKSGPRVPISAVPQHWHAAVKVGRRLIWLHTYAERMRDTSAGRGSHVPFVDGLGWDAAVTEMPEQPADLVYDMKSRRLHIRDGIVAGVSPEVWNFSVSGMPVVKKWLAYRTKRGSGRAATSKNPLDQIRPERWPDEWNDELLDLLRVLSLTCEERPNQDELFRTILSSELVDSDALPKPKPSERAVPSMP